MEHEIYKAVDQNPNMKSYEESVKNFSWEEAKKHFTWYETGKVNMAYEAIDRHVDEGYGDKVALHYKNGDEIKTFTFKEMKEKSNKAANMLVEKGVKKGDRVFIFMPRSPELYFVFIGAIKIGAIVGPLFEAFMEKAVVDRLEDSEANILITTSDLLERVPYNDIDTLEHVFVVGDDVKEDEKV
ncbi:MAG TPA: AMP-binding protein, partial [Candidatus Nosocomiicoccus stercorigallinarum]|nr:AMP-binding protein [Candidatus Nosocomiicoccus stercorigallinarum]